MASSKAKTTVNSDKAKEEPTAGNPLARIQHCAVMQRYQQCFYTPVPEKKQRKHPLTSRVQKLFTFLQKKTESAWQERTVQSTSGRVKYRRSSGRIALDAVLFILLASAVGITVYLGLTGKSGWIPLLIIVFFLLLIILLYSCYPPDCFELVCFETCFMWIARSIPFFAFLLVILMLLVPYSNGDTFNWTLFRSTLIVSAIYGGCAFVTTRIFGLGDRYWMFSPSAPFTYLMVLSLFTYLSLLVSVSIPLAYLLDHDCLGESLNFFAAAALGTMLPYAIEFHTRRLSSVQDVVNALDAMGAQLDSASLDFASLADAAMDLDKALNKKILPNPFSKPRFASPELRFTILSYVNQLLHNGDGTTRDTRLASYMKTHFQNTVTADRRELLEKALKHTPKKGRGTQSKSDAIRKDLEEFANDARECLVPLLS